MTAQTAQSVVIDDMLANVAKKSAPAKRRKPAAKPTAKKAPAKQKDTVAPSPKDGQHRGALLEELKAAGWTGPTSYTATMLRETVLPWVKAGCPEGNESIPAGAMNHAHPKPKATKSPKQSAAYQRGYQQALSDLSDLPTLKAMREYIAANLSTEAGK